MPKKTLYEQHGLPNPYPTEEGLYTDTDVGILPVLPPAPEITDLYNPNQATTEASSNYSVAQELIKNLGAIGKASNLEQIASPSEVTVDLESIAVHRAVMLQQQELSKKATQAQLKQFADKQQLSFAAHGASGGSSYDLAVDSAMLTAAYALGVDLQNKAAMNEFESQVRAQIAHQKTVNEERERITDENSRRESNAEEAGVWGFAGAFIGAVIGGSIGGPAGAAAGAGIGGGAGSSLSYFF